MRSRKSRSLLALCVASAMLAASTPTFADSSHDPAITEARADGGMLHILGLNLGGGKPKVTLGTLALSVVSMTATQIDALVPPTVVPGSYLLTVSLAKSKSGSDDGNGDGKYDEFWVTIGAAGPQGLVGPQGAAGKDGAMGPAGPVGPAGTNGAAGVQGPAGRDGAQGSQGPSGPQGIAGLHGATGAQGPAGPQGPQGPSGPSGPSGPRGVSAPPVSFMVYASRVHLASDPAGSDVLVQAECPTGTVLTGGNVAGFGYDDIFGWPNGNSWWVSGTTRLLSNPSAEITATAICLFINVN